MIETLLIAPCMIGLVLKFLGDLGRPLPVPVVSPQQHAADHPDEAIHQRGSLHAPSEHWFGVFRNRLRVDGDVGGVEAQHPSDGRQIGDGRGRQGKDHVHP
jgi:hypothetical protein